MNAISINWDKWGEAALMLISALHSSILVLYSQTQSIYVMYACYIAYRSLYQVMITIAQFVISYLSIYIYFYSLSKPFHSPSSPLYSLNNLHPTHLLIYLQYIHIYAYMHVNCTKLRVAVPSLKTQNRVSFSMLRLVQKSL